MPPREHLILCGRRARRTTRAAAWKRAKVVQLDATQASGNVHLHIHDITSRMTANLPAVAQDLVELATYVYAADQASGRGSAARLDYGREWRRRFRFEVPVRRPDVWRDPRVTGELVRTLSFLSDDDYEFAFVPQREPAPWGEYLVYEPGGPEPSDVAEVMMFSGGLDSAAGAVEEVLVSRCKVALVCHRPVSKLDRRQMQVYQEVSRRAEGTAPLPFHVPVLVNKREDIGIEYTQRTRSFLFAAFGSVVARLFGLSRLRFYENGIVSCNLPISPQVLGGRASRTTHPRVLQGFERLLSLLFEHPFHVENPFLAKTRTDVIDGLRAAGHGSLAAHTVSCAHTWQAKAEEPHCGTCSQCVDRRLAALAAGLTDAEDPRKRYRTDLFTGELKDVLEQTMVERVIGTAREVNRIASPVEFLRRFGEASRLLPHFGAHSEEAAVRLLELHRRHARQVTGVLDAQLSSSFTTGSWRRLPPTCLLRIVGRRSDSQGAGESLMPEGNELSPHTFVPTKDDSLILDVLFHSSTTCVQVIIENAAKVSRKTVGRRLREMLRCGVIHYPHGAKKGAALTPAGRALAAVTPKAKAG